MRDRWCGPGVVILQEKGTVWVGVKNRIWKCNPDQVRGATNPEALGAELLQREHLSKLLREARQGGGRAGPVDVSAEGPPDEEKIKIMMWVRRRQHPTTQWRHQRGLLILDGWRPPSRMPESNPREQEPRRVLA